MSYKRSKLQYWNTILSPDRWSDTFTASTQNPLISAELIFISTSSTSGKTATVTADV